MAPVTNGCVEDASVEEGEAEDEAESEFGAQAARGNSTDSKTRNNLFFIESFVNIFIRKSLSGLIHKPQGIVGQFALH